MKKYLFLAIFGAFYALGGGALHAASIPFSQYGAIQNVQNYSSNPFWNPNGPYNQRIVPQAVYVTGPDVTSGDCQRTVAYLIAEYCNQNNRCIGQVLSDIRPTIVLQLSRLPGHNFATACVGYIDGEFQNYVNTAPTIDTTATFPTATMPNPNIYNDSGGGTIVSPPTPALPKWQQEMKQRTEELERLQSESSAGEQTLARVDFPKTINDVSFVDRVANMAAGYAPYADKSAYVPIDIESMEDYLGRLKVADYAAWCAHTHADECDARPEQEQTYANNDDADNTNADNTGNNDDNENASDDEILEAILKVLGADTQVQEEFFKALALSYIEKNRADETVHLDDAFVLNFLGDGNNLEKYKSGLVGLTGETKDDKLGIDINWDDVLIAVSNVLDNANKKRGLLVCENNRSLQFSVDAVAWAATAIAAVFTLFAGGAGGVAVAAGRAAIGAGLKAAATVAAKAGGKIAAKNLSKRAGKQYAKAAIKLGMKRNMRGYAKYKGRGVLRNGVKTFVKQVGLNMTKKRVLIGGGAGLLWITGADAAARSSVMDGMQRAAGTFYSIVSSDEDKEIVNCQDLDHQEGCYSVCGDAGAGNDDLNTKILYPMFKKRYCVNPDDYSLYEIKSDKSRGDPLVFDAKQWDKMKQDIKSKIQDKGKCDYNEDDIDMYIGYWLHDPDTLNPSKNDLVIEDILRLDD